MRQFNKKPSVQHKKPSVQHASQFNILKASVPHKNRLFNTKKRQFNTPVSSTPIFVVFFCSELTSVLNWRFFVLSRRVCWTDVFFCWVDGYFVLSWRVCWTDGFYVLNWRVCWTKAFYVINRRTLSYEKEWPFCVELMFWTDGCVEVKGTQ